MTKLPPVELVLHPHRRYGGDVRSLHEKLAGGKRLPLSLVKRVMHSRRLTSKLSSKRIHLDITRQSRTWNAPSRPPSLNHYHYLPSLRPWRVIAFVADFGNVQFTVIHMSDEITPPGLRAPELVPKGPAWDYDVMQQEDVLATAAIMQKCFQLIPEDRATSMKLFQDYWTKLE
ncbi:hypothetical protein AZE42_02301 [Rhizopogon vesiculosus]|uniref:Uncharacterized protein n=1 Tax=Rhizopogon vesiculosus TaxID=180088 RepID=A0A1J8QJ71_9AGAM|nr:hypothetical protein AZE42_02301 [Rhizopogon vesiculosus]